MTSSQPFEQFNLNPLLLHAVVKKHLTATSIQQKTIPMALTGKDILGSAPTGTGKTWAFLLPAIQHLLDSPHRYPGSARVLILAPTRELVMQIAAEARYLTQYTALKTALITGGVSYTQHTDILNNSADILIATTGRLLQYIREQHFDGHAIELLILDEADRMLDMGFAQDVEIIASQTQHRKQTLLFSATLEGHAVFAFAQRILHDPYTITTAPSRRERKKIQQNYYYADNLSHKIALLIRILSLEKCHKAIVFVRKREQVHQLVAHLKAHAINCTCLEGEMVQIKRNNAIKQVQKGRARILIATDVAARGLDIDDISHVINFDLPCRADVYLHRIGRTARGGKKGTALSLIEAHDYDLLTKIEHYLALKIKARIFSDLKPLTKTPIITKKKDVSAKDKQRQKFKTSSKDKKRPKQRARNRKNIGKRRQPSATSGNTA